MIPSPTLVTLTPETRLALKDFLGSQFGENLMQVLNAMCPSILEAGTMENQLASAQRHAGYEACMGNILFLIEPPPSEEEEPQSTSYPSLDDEDKWKGEKKPAEKQ